MVPKLTNPVPSASPRYYNMEDGAKSPEDIHLPPSPPAEAVKNASPVTPTTKWLLPERPAALRRATSPESIPTITTSIVSLLPQSQTRPKSPGTRHLRSSPSSSSTGSLPLQRAHSSPGIDSTGRFISPQFGAPGRPSSPSGQYGRRRSPLRSGMDDQYPTAPSWSGLNIEPNIPEHAELDLGSTHLSTVSESDVSQLLPSSFHNTFPRSRRRPTSPLHQSASAPALHAMHTRATSPHASGSTSPSSAAQRYANEPYPGYSFSTASSMPSTPTSLRSRSPSISSLETIEDTPEAEEAAIQEAEEMAKLRAEDVEISNGDLRRRSSLELRSGALRSNKERKRWSVCGAERRADFSLEPIEE